MFWCSYTIICTETCQSCCNVNFNIVFQTTHSCISCWINKTLIKSRCMVGMRKYENIFLYLMVSYFCSSNKWLVLVSYDSPFFRKYFKMIFNVSLLVCMHTNGILFVTYISTGPFKGLWHMMKFNRPSFLKVQSRLLHKASFTV